MTKGMLVSHQVGDWGQCSATCGGGIQNRTVQCMDQFGKTAASSYCVSANEPPDQLPMQPAGLVTSVSSTDCSGQVSNL